MGGLVAASLIRLIMDFEYAVAALLVGGAAPPLRQRILMGPSGILETFDGDNG